MGITVHEALKIGGLRDGKVIAGFNGLERVIEYVTVLEVPDIIKWLKGGELVLTSGFAISAHEKEQEELICQFAEKGIAAMAIKSQRFLSTIPQAILEAAEKNNLPIIEFPPDVTYQDIIRPVMTAVIHNENKGYALFGEMERNLKENFIEDLLLNHIKSDTVAKRRISLLGLSAASTYGIAVIKTAHKEQEMDFSQYLQPLEKRLEGKGWKAIAVTANNRIIILVDLEGKEDAQLRDFSVFLHENLCQLVRAPLSMGVGEVFNSLLETRRSFLQAQEAVEFGNKYWGHNTYSLFSDLGLYRLIHEISSREGIWEYIPKGLKNLLEYDKYQGTELQKTLLTYLNNGGNSQKTSAQLFIHYKTLQYRLKRIAEVTGLDLDSGESRFMLHLGLKIIDGIHKRA